MVAPFDHFYGGDISLAGEVHLPGGQAGRKQRDSSAPPSAQNSYPFSDHFGRFMYVILMGGRCHMIEN